MSAVLAQATATFASNGASITLSASNADDLIASLGKFGISVGSQPANDTSNKSAATAKPAAKAEAGNAPASTADTPASAPAAAAGSEAPAADAAPRPTYDDVKARVLALAKVSREKAQAALAKFKVDHANKLKLEDYPGFIAHADQVLKGGASA